VNLLERTVVAIETLAVRRTLASLPVAAVREEKRTPSAAGPCAFSPPPEVQFAAPPPPPAEQQPSLERNTSIATPSSSSSMPTGGDQISTTIEVPDDGDSSGEDAQVADKSAVVPKAGEEERAEVRQT